MKNNTSFKKKSSLIFFILLVKNEDDCDPTCIFSMFPFFLISSNLKRSNRKDIKNEVTRFSYLEITFYLSI